MPDTEREIAVIQQRMLDNAIQHLIDQGVSPAEAKARAISALNAPPTVPIPTMEELAGLRFLEVDANTPDDLVDEFLFGEGGTKAIRLDIDWSECPLVRRHPDYLGGTLAMVSSPRMPIEAIVTNYNGGYEAERIATLFDGLNVDDVKAIIAYALERS